MSTSDLDEEETTGATTGAAAGLTAAGAAPAVAVAGGRCWHFQHHFVGFDIDKNFVSADGFADFLFPLQQSGFCHRFG